MGTSLKQTGFGGGVVSPQVLGRSDQQKYAVGLAQCTNAWVTRYGTIENRPGTQFIAEVKDSSTTKRLVPFETAVDQGVLLEFGANYIRFYKNGEAILAPISGGAYSSGTTYALGAAVTYSGATYVSLKAINTNNQPDTSTAWWAPYSTGTGGQLQITTPVPQGSLTTLQSAQINDLMYLADQGVYPQVLSHYGDTEWSIANIALGPGIDPPTNVMASAGTAGSGTYTYVVTTVSKTGAESIASATTGVAIGGQPTNNNPNVITWTANPDPNTQSYNVYLSTNGVYAFIGNTGGLAFNDGGIIASTEQQPPVKMDMLATTSDYPAVVSAYQQRLCLANTVNEPQSVWMSTQGVYTSFMTVIPLVDNQSIKFVIAGTHRQYVRALVDLGKLIVHTSNNEYVAQGNQFGAVTPTATTLVVQGSAGCAAVPPVTIGNSDVFLQQGATRLNDLQYDVRTFAYGGKDLTKIATDLFRGRTIVAMAWQRLPHSIVWCVLDNGTMAGLTYVRDDDMWAWHLHTFTNGAVENVCVVPEGASSTLYLLIRRTVSGATKRYIERLAARDLIDTTFFTDAVFADCSLTYDGRNTGSRTMTLTTSAGWTTTDLLTITASSSYFSPSDVGNNIVIQQIDSTTGQVADFVTVKILAYTSGFQVNGQPLGTVSAWAQNAPTTSWGKAVKSFSGIDHLEGQSLAVLADGNVVASPLKPNLPVVTVTGGAFTLTEPAMVVTAGLPIQMDVETLPVENAQGETILNKRIAVREATPVFYRSRDGLYGQDAQHLNAWKQPKSSAPGYPDDAVTGPYRVPINGAPQRTGQVHIRHVDPVPWSISAIIVTGEIGS